MKRIRQPEGSSLCGQIAVAVVTGLPLDQVIRVGFGGRRGTTGTKQIIRALRILSHGRLGGSGFVAISDRLERSRRTDVAIARLSYAPRPSWSSKQGGFIDRRPASGHWVVWEDGRIWDGIFGDRDGNYEWPEGAKLTSFLPLDKHYGRSVTSVPMREKTTGGNAL